MNAKKKKIKTQTSVYLVTSINVIFTTGTVYILSWVLFKTEKGSKKITVIFLDTHKELLNSEFPDISMAKFVK